VVLVCPRIRKQEEGRTNHSHGNCSGTNASADRKEDDAIVHMICVDEEPLTLTRKQGFKHFLKVSVPRLLNFIH